MCGAAVEVVVWVEIGVEVGVEVEVTQWQKIQRRIYMSLAWEGNPQPTREPEDEYSFLDSLPDPPETPAAREYRLWREQLDDESSLDWDETHQLEEDTRNVATNN
jgi:hypothetical protein